MTSVQQFLRRMLWRSAGWSDPEPVVALLGPRGSGKSTALRALSRECGGTVVHAGLDFAEHPDHDPVSAVAFLAFLLMRDWANERRRPVFHRLGLSLLALNERLSQDRAVAQGQIKDLIRQYVQRQPLVRAGERATEPLFTGAEVAGAIGGIALPDVAIREQAKPVIAALLRGAERWRLRGAMRWHHTLPEAEDASTVDSLIALSTVQRSNALNHVLKAFLADVEEFTRKHPPAVAKCDCAVPDDVVAGSHDHCWLLLLDNAQATTGEQVLRALITVRQELRTDPAVTRSDPLLVVTAVDQWRPAWGQWWREPWQTSAAVAGRQPIPLFSSADRGQWVRHARQSAGPRVNPARGWYPVWLDPVPEDGVFGPPAGSAWDQTDSGAIVSRLASGHPKAAIDIQAQIDALHATTDDGPIPTAILDAQDETGVALWERGLHACRPGLVPADRPWRAVPPAVVVAARLSEPARRSDDLPADRFPGAVQAMRELRTNLWVTTFAARPSPLWQVGRGSEEHPAALHPWLSRCLLAGLAAESAGADPSPWDDLFATIHDIEPDPGRTLFRDLAQGRFGAVVKELVGLFDTIDHRAWVRVLDDATSAPCRLPHSESFEVSYRRLAPDHVPGRTAIEAAVTSLTALLWLYRDPLTVPGPLYGASWHRQAWKDLDKLAHASARSDVSALEEAASQFET